MAGGRQIHAHGIAAGASMGTARIVIRTHLWNPWTRIAMKHEAMAQAARREAQWASRHRQSVAIASAGGRRCAGVRLCGCVRA
jgi:hypothetical protein